MQIKCDQIWTSRILTFYIFMSASIAGLRLVVKSSKGEHSHPAYCSVRSAVSRGLSTLKYERRLRYLTKSNIIQSKAILPEHLI
jgi:hypothetical protein